MYQLFIDILTSPSVAFERLRERPNFWLPMLVILVGIVVTNVVYTQMVDREFMIEDVIESAGEDMTNAEAEQVRNLYSESGTTMMMVGMITGVLGMVILQAIHAAYFMLVARFSGTALGFKAWFGFVWWTSVPRILSFLASAVAVFMAPDGKIGVYESNPLSLAGFFDLEMGSGALAQLLSSFDVTTVWSIVLMVIGTKLWMEKSWGLSTVIVLVPYLLVYGIWAWVVL